MREAAEILATVGPEGAQKAVRPIPPDVEEKARQTNPGPPRGGGSGLRGTTVGRVPCMPYDEEAPC